MVEGAKSVGELLASDFEVLTIVGTAPYMLQKASKINSQIEMIEVG